MKQSKEYKNNNKERGLLNDSYQNNIRRFLEKIISFFMNLFIPRLEEPNEREQILIEELRESTLNFNYESRGSNAEDEWMKHAKRVSKLIKIDDPRRFLTWNPVKDTMGGSNYLFVLKELKYLKSRPDWETRWKRVLTEDKIGNQTPFFFFPTSSGNLIHHAYVIAKFEEKTGKKIEAMKFIFEFGGGYGSVCRLIHRLGFKGKYLIYDISVFSQLQIFFLKNIGFSIYNIEEFKNTDISICCISDMNQLAELLLENSSSVFNNLFIAMWSISETPINAREPIIKYLDNFSNFILGYQNRFGEVDNQEYFASMKNKHQNVCWHDESLRHLPKHNLLLGSTIEGKEYNE